MEKVKLFFTNVKTEMIKVSWPTRQELVDSTSVVIVSVVLLAVVVGVVDLLFTYIIGLIVR